MRTPSDPVSELSPASHRRARTSSGDHAAARRLKATDRQRKHRAREDKGRAVLLVDVDEVALSAALLEAGLIGVNDQNNRQKLAAALSRVIDIIIIDLSFNQVMSRVTAPPI
jgi:hypothetical protein